MINIKTFLISAKILYLINYHAYATYTNLNLSGSNTIITGGNFPVVGNITSSSGAPTLTINIGAENWEITSNILAPILTVIKTGSSMLTLSGTNTYTGVTTISAGTLQICSGSTTGSINSNGISNNGDLIFNRFDAYPYSGVISGTGAVTKSGAGILTLSGANTYTGTTTVSAGILNISAANGIGLGSTLTLSGGALQAEGDFTLSRAITLTSSTNSTIDTQSYAMILSGVISGAGNFIKSGVGTLTLTDNNTYAGTTTISEGTLVGRISGALSLSSGATYYLGTAARTLTSISDVASSSIGLCQDASDATARTLTLNNSSGLTVASVLTGAGGLTKIGSGILTLSGNNQYTGTTTISAGTLNISAETGIGPPGAATLTLSGGTLQAGWAFTLSRAITLTSSTNSTVDTQSYAMTLSGVITGAGNFIKSGAGTLTLSGSNANTGTITVSQGTLELASSGAGNSTNNPTINLSTDTTLKSSVAASFANPIIFTGNTVTINTTAATTFSGALTGITGALTISGGQNVTLSGTQSGAFTTTVSGANTKLIIPQAVTLSTGAITIGANASFQATGFKTIAKAITFG